MLTEENKAQLAKGTHLPIMEEFYTIQGEGFHAGKAAYFIRIGGCDVGCHWCDVKESWNPDLHPTKSVDEVIENAKKHPAKAVVITGGEPSTYNLTYLTEKLNENGIDCYLETSGVGELTGTWHWICFSPKKTVKPKDSILKTAHELKVIIYNNNDFEWAKEWGEKVNGDCRLYLQPEWSKREQMMPAMVDFIMDNPRWNMSLQTHKYMNIP